MPKRITYLEKKDGLSRQAFQQHWRTVHADIARQLPGVVSYRQNHVISTHLVPVDDLAYPVDGIVELWFTDDAAAGAGFGSRVADLLIEDEPKFLSGLVGAAVDAVGATPEWPGKVWLLGRWSGPPDEDALRTWVQETAAALAAPGSDVNVLVPDAAVLMRAGLRHDGALPQVAIAFGFASVDEAGQRVPQLEAAFRRYTGLQRKQVVVAREEVVV
ncbi:EthD family reductase [Intrasporangium calvum]|uniref:EthD family reductase n=1 Tax=Intrasporangium calvum TaxID=53358 RepID=A0ABT5GE32_9MICO|nr:EthD family reductase [Intrasporangium calvum]MDC5696515.1 EthD family reductase [Intrasporangium calvum]